MAKKSRVKIRKKWHINPSTRVKDSAKKYRRPKAKANHRRTIKKGTI